MGATSAIGRALGGSDASPGWLSPGSLLTFPASSAAIKGAWEVLRIPLGEWGDSAWLPIVMGMLIAAAFYATNYPPADDPNRKAKIFAGLVLVPFNGLLLAGGALGIEGAVDEAATEVS